MSAALPDVPNFRDAGGLATDSGQVMRRGVVYRSAQLLEADTRAGGRAGRLGVSGVYDLRTAAEVDAPARLAAGGHHAVVDDVLADRPHSAAAEVASIVNSEADRASWSRVNDAWATAGRGS